MRDTERQRHRQREKQAFYGEPDMGLDPGTPGSQPEPKADAQPMKHPGVPSQKFTLKNLSHVPPQPHPQFSITRSFKIC